MAINHALPRVLESFQVQLTTQQAAQLQVVRTAVGRKQAVEKQTLLHGRKLIDVLYVLGHLKPRFGLGGWEWELVSFQLR